VCRVQADVVLRRHEVGGGGVELPVAGVAGEARECSPGDLQPDPVAAVSAANRVAGRFGYRAQAAAFTEFPMGGSCIDFVYREIGCAHSYAVELPPSLPWGAC
jgi:hypothetical protein